MAVALAVGLHECEDEKIVVIFDLGATTFEVAVIRAFSGEIDVKSRAKDTNLGGSILDQLLADHCMEMYENEHGFTLDDTALDVAT